MTLLEQLLRDKETGPKLIALAEKYMENELIPGTDELNRLKDFLADFKSRCCATREKTILLSGWVMTR